LAAAPALQALTFPFLALSVAVLSRGWYLSLSHKAGMVWQRRSRRALVFSTALAGVLWGLRFSGALGPQPF